MSKTELHEVSDLQEVNWKHIAHGLYRILDDISTASDHYRPDNTRYTNYIHHKLRKVSDYMETDGYSVYGKTNLPVESVGNNPMVEYFADSYISDVEFDKTESVNNIPKFSRADLHSTMDANIWAREMCTMFKHIYKYDIDEEWIHSWMCNAIMCGYDHANWKRDKEYIYVLKAHGCLIKIYHYEPNEVTLKRDYMEYLRLDEAEFDIKTKAYLYRWSRNNGLMQWDGLTKNDTLYEWKGTN